MTQGAVDQASAGQADSTSTKYVYFFGGGKADGNGRMKDVLGGKGAGLAEMTNAGLPVPPGFTIQTEACREYMRGAVSPAIDIEMHAALDTLEKLQGQKLGTGENPLLVSVRSGAKFSMPGMMDTILNLGLNDQAVEALAAQHTPSCGHCRLPCHRRRSTHTSLKSSLLVQQTPDPQRPASWDKASVCRIPRVRPFRVDGGTEAQPIDTRTHVIRRSTCASSRHPTAPHGIHKSHPQIAPQV